MGLFKRASGSGGRGRVQPSVTLGHPGVEAFVAELAAEDLAGASRRLQALGSYELRHFHVDAATSEGYLDAGAPGAPDVPAGIRRWTEVMPGDPSAWLVRGAFAVSAGWAARGSGAGSTVGTEARDLFFARLEEAEAALRRAIALDDADPTPWVFLLTSGRGLEVTKDELWARFTEAKRRDPGLLAAHLQLLQGITEKWGGTHEAMFAFARTTSDASPPGSPLPVVVVQAHIERWLSIGCNSSSYFPLGRAEEIRAVAERSVLHPAFCDDEDHPDGAVARNVMAVGLGLAELPSARREQARLIGTRLTHRPWINIGDPAERFEAYLGRGPV